MTTGVVLFRKSLWAVSLLIGVTLFGFVLMVYFGPPIEYTMVGKNPTDAQLAQIRDQFHLDEPVLARYARYVKGLFAFDFGASFSTGRPVLDHLRESVPVSLAIVVPGFVLGNLGGLGLALLAAHRRGGALDRIIVAASVMGMSVSVVIVVMLLQVALSSSFGLNLFPSRGWRVDSLASYGRYATVPVLSMVLVTLGYNTRFYRAVLVEQLNAAYVITARAYGAGPAAVMLRHVLPNALPPMITRVLFTLPFVAISGSLVIERYFGIPGVGLLTYNAMQSNDQPVLLAVVTVTAILFVAVLGVSDTLYRAADPRLRRTRPDGRK